MAKKPVVLSASERRWVMAISGVAERTLRNWQAGKARRGSAERIEQALEQLRSKEGRR